MKKLLMASTLIVFASPLAAQMPYGLSSYNDMDAWCSSSRPMTATYSNFEPKRVLSGLQRAAKCKFSLVVSYPRRLYTNGWNNSSGDYSATKHRALSDSFAKYLPPDTLKKYVANKTLLGVVTGDDYGCEPCWNGEKIPWDEARDAANYAKKKMPDAPIGVRADAIKMGAVTGWQIDFGWAQWIANTGNLKRYGDAAVWYQKNYEEAMRLGLKGMFYGLNTTHCTGAGDTPPCTAAQVTNWGNDALLAPKNCGLISWRWDTHHWQGAYKTAWVAVFNKAKTAAFTSCRK